MPIHSSTISGLATQTRPYYKFKDNYIIAKNIIDAYPFTVVCKTRTPTTFTALHTLYCFHDENHSERYIGLETTSDGSLRLIRRSVGTEYKTDTLFNLSADTEYDITAVFTSATAVKVYVNGGEIYDGSSLDSVAINSYFDVFMIGTFRKTSPSGYWNGQISNITIFDIALSAAEISEITSGASIPYKYKDTGELCENGDFEKLSASSTTATNWSGVQSGTWAIGTLIHDISGSYAPDVGSHSLRCYGGTNSIFRHDTITVESGVKYKVSYWSWQSSADANAQARLLVGTSAGASDYWTGSQSHTNAWTYQETEITTSSTSLFIDCKGDNAPTNIWFDGISVKRVSNVIAEYDGGGMSKESWKDKSGNGLDGKVDGPILVNQQAFLDVSGNASIGGGVKLDNVAARPEKTLNQLYAVGGDLYWGDTKIARGPTIEKSLRFNAEGGEFLSKTYAEEGDRSEWTFSAWVKRGSIPSSGRMVLFGGYTAQTDAGWLEFGFDSNTLYWTTQGSSGTTTALWRDNTAWYHIVITLVQVSSTSTMTAYVNNVEHSFSGTVPSGDKGIASGGLHRIGQCPQGSSRYYDGLLADVHFLDGIIVGPNAFGEEDPVYGYWKPKTYTGAYGLLGFKLDFADDTNLGKDVGGNNHDYALNSGTHVDQILDNPNNNFCTLSTLTKWNNESITQGNMEQDSADGDASIVANMGVSSGKWYYEVRWAAAANTRNWGWVRSDQPGIARTYSDPGHVYLGHSTSANTPYSIGYYGAGAGGGAIENSTGSTGNFTIILTLTNYTQVAANAICACALDLDNGKIEWFINGVSQGGQLARTMLLMDSKRSVHAWLPAFRADHNQIFTANFGQDATFAGRTFGGNDRKPTFYSDANGLGEFAYKPPAGFLAICTENLPNSPASKPSDHFKALKYTGNGTSSNEVTGVGFRPDLVWIKGTEAGYDWGCWDTNRGKHSRQILSSGGAAETQTNFASFDNDGFSVASGNLVNQDTKVYHAYCWKAGASAKSNTDGSTVAHVSANQAAGFSIVKWFGTNGNHTVGHGLLRAPEYIIAKDIDRTDQYRVGHQYYHATTPWTYNTALSQPLAPWANNNVWNQTAPTDTVVALGDELTQNSAHRGIAYCWHSVDGYSKIGLYYGNGSTDGPFVYCGFKPAYLWMKNIDSGTENFAVLDNATNPSNVANTMSFWGETDADQTHDVNRVDFLSNGFKIRGNDARWNTDNARYAFVAFAEQPQKYATAR